MKLLQFNINSKKSMSIWRPTLTNKPKRTYATHFKSRNFSCMIQFAMNLHIENACFVPNNKYLIQKEREVEQD